MRRTRFKDRARDLFNAAIGRYGYRLVPSSVLYDWQVQDRSRTFNDVASATASSEDLDVNHPRLKELIAGYATMDPIVTTPSVWTEEHVTPDDLRHFRGDNAYVWQVRKAAEINFGLVTYYLKTIDHLDLLDRLEEDSAFGAFTFAIAGRLVSRDLLDSVTEIYFLERHLSLSSRSDFTILDIGAGYGRLAHRVAHSLHGVRRYICTDAVPVSTFLCEFYIRFRQLQNRVAVVPLHTLERDLADQEIDLAVNIHSFSECTVPAIDWWIRSLRSRRVRYLMIAPNRTSQGSGEPRLATSRGEDFLPVIRDKGYRPIAMEPKYRDPHVQKYGIYPTHYWLFELD